MLLLNHVGLTGRGHSIICYAFLHSMLIPVLLVPELVLCFRWSAHADAHTQPTKAAAPAVSARTHGGCQAGLLICE